MLSTPLLHFFITSIKNINNTPVYSLKHMSGVFIIAKVVFHHQNNEVLQTKFPTKSRIYKRAIIV